MPEYREYPAVVTHVIDGDTIDVVLDLGFDPITTTRRLRLELLNCPDDEDLEGKAAATEFTTRWLGRHRDVLVRTRKTRRGSAERDKYGRIVATVYSADRTACLNDDLVCNGHAVIRRY